MILWRFAAQDRQTSIVTRCSLQLLAPQKGSISVCRRFVILREHKEEKKQQVKTRKERKVKKKPNKARNNYITYTIVLCSYHFNCPYPKSDFFQICPLLGPPGMTQLVLTVPFLRFFTIPNSFSHAFFLWTFRPFSSFLFRFSLSFKSGLVAYFLSFSFMRRRASVQRKTQRLASLR